MKSKGPQVFLVAHLSMLRQCWARTREAVLDPGGAVMALNVAPVTHVEPGPGYSGRIFSPRKTELAYPSKRPDRGEGAQKKNAKGVTPLKFNMEPEKKSLE